MVDICGGLGFTHRGRYSGVSGQDGGDKEGGCPRVGGPA